MNLVQSPMLSRPAMNCSQDVMFEGRKKVLAGPEGIQTAFKAQRLNITLDQAKAIESQVDNAVTQIKKNPKDGSLVGFAAIQIGAELKLNLVADSSIKDRISDALKAIAASRPDSAEPPKLNAAWDAYFDKTVNLTNNRQFTAVVAEKKFSPVKISWEDIGRDVGSSVGSRISDVGIWVRKDEKDPKSAKLALTVRRDQNFRDKVLVVPAEKIKIHGKVDGKMTEVTLPAKLKELGLTSKDHDKNVIVSNQFSIVPVPAKEMGEVSKAGVPPRSAFNFSIYPYGSSNFVITDVIEGSSNAVVSGSGHQNLFANVDGQKAPFTASRAADRKDLVKLEKELKKQGMDVDVQRYYLIQVPLKSGANITPSNMGEPPMERGGWGGMPFAFSAFESASDGMMLESLAAPRSMARAASAGLDKVAIGTGDTEGPYSEGSGYRGQRAEEPIRVTVCYFVTPKGEVTAKDMENFSKKFEEWDKEALWGGSFVVPESNK